jgi:hypothetical protein
MTRLHSTRNPWGVAVTLMAVACQSLAPAVAVGPGVRVGGGPKGGRGGKQ